MLKSKPNETESVQVTAKVTNTTNGVKRKFVLRPGFDGYFNVTKCTMMDCIKMKLPVMESMGHNSSTRQWTFCEILWLKQFPTIPKALVYMPEGAEHDVYVYQVNLIQSNTNQIVINEIMAANTKTVTDQDGEFDD